MEKPRSMLFENGALKCLWIKTMNTNKYLVNRFLISTNQEMTPLQVFIGKNQIMPLQHSCKALPMSLLG